MVENYSGATCPVVGPGAAGSFPPSGGVCEPAPPPDPNRCRAQFTNTFGQPTDRIKRRPYRTSDVQ